MVTFILSPCNHTAFVHYERTVTFRFLVRLLTDVRSPDCGERVRRNHIPDKTAWFAPSPPLFFWDTDTPQGQFSDIHLLHLSQRIPAGPFAGELLRMNSKRWLSGNAGWHWIWCWKPENQYPHTPPLFNTNIPHVQTSPGQSQPYSALPDTAPFLLTRQQLKKIPVTGDEGIWTVSFFLNASLLVKHKITDLRHSSNTFAYQ